MDSLLSVESSSLKVGSFSFGSSLSAYAVSKPIFEIKSTEDNTKITTPIFSVSGKIVSFGYPAETASPKSSGCEFADYSSTSGSGSSKFGSSKGGIEFSTYPKINTEYVSGE